VHERRAYLQTALCLLVLLPGLLYPIKAIPARHKDTFTEGFTLNGYAYMDKMPLIGDVEPISLKPDRDLIAYMRANIKGYPVIAESYLREYYWNSRISSYTGLPGVVGWQNHLRQQYPHHIEEVEERGRDMRLFYYTTSPTDILDLIRKYNIQYIVSGALEQSLTAGAQDATLRQLVITGHLAVVYDRDGTRLYRVLKSSL
jgi:uncharacterized membrane protein